MGLPLNALSVYGMISTNFEIVAAFLWNAPHHIGRAAVALAHAAVLILLVKEGSVPWLTSLPRRCRPDGVLGLHRHVDHLRRHLLLARVRPDWTAAASSAGRTSCWEYGRSTLAWSPWWLRRFRFGPLEWCWRSLTYWRRQPMRREPIVAAADATTPAY